MRSARRQELGERLLAGWAWRAFARLAERRGDLGEAESGTAARERRRPSAPK